MVPDGGQGGLTVAVWTATPPASAGLWWGVNRATGTTDLIEVTEVEARPEGLTGGPVLVYRWGFGRTAHPTSVWSAFTPVCPPGSDSLAPRDVDASVVTMLGELYGDPQAPAGQPAPAVWPDGTPVAPPEMVTLSPAEAQPPCVRHEDPPA